tara:strand:- start:1511 stop:1984 length:474 start_codon:yes stop_codon:yes gene_type:complete
LSQKKPININGWYIYAHPLFVEEIERLTVKVSELRLKYPDKYKEKNATKILAAIKKLAFQDIPNDPTQKQYRQGDTLGEEHKHWFRAKFYQQYRLFFRYHLKSKIIVYVWVNNEKTKRAYESKHDAYRAFKKMLLSGNPPNSWDDLLEASIADLDHL